MKGIYLIESDGFYKIGITGNLSARSSQLRGSSPHGITIHHFCHLNIDAEDEFGKNWALFVERRFHFALRKYHYNCEWFKLPKAVFDTIDEMFWNEEYPAKGREIDESTTRCFCV